MKKVFLAVFIVAVSITVLAILGGKTLENDQNITFGLKWVNQAQFAGYFTAKDKGFYQTNGINVDFKEFEFGGSVLKDLKAKKTDLGLMSANEYLQHIAEGEDLVAVAAFYQNSPYIVASLEESGITSPRQLKGKVLGVKGGSGAEGEPILGLLLEAAGLSLEDVTIKYLPLEGLEYQDLKSGTVDVIGFYRTRLYQLEQEDSNYNIIYPEQYGAAFYNDVLVARRDTVEKRPEMIKRFIAASIEGWEYAFAHQDEALDIVLGYVTHEDYKDRDYQAYILKQSEPLIKPSEDFAIGKMTKESWQRFYQVMKQRGVVKDELEVEDIFTLDFLPQ
ncbi:MAG: ABC transporter substrate-binding protein [Candidatus Paceibacterota bacterium]